MYLFAVRSKVQPGKTEEFARKWKDFYDSRAKQMPEFQQAYYAADFRDGYYARTLDVEQEAR